VTTRVRVILLALQVAAIVAGIWLGSVVYDAVASAA
jgi:hypothetical protein